MTETAWNKTPAIRRAWLINTAQLLKGRKLNLTTVQYVFMFSYSYNYKGDIPVGPSPVNIQNTLNDAGIECSFELHLNNEISRHSALSLEQAIIKACTEAGLDYNLRTSTKARTAKLLDKMAKELKANVYISISGNPYRWYMGSRESEQDLTYFNYIKTKVNGKETA